MNLKYPEDIAIINAVTYAVYSNKHLSNKLLPSTKRSLLILICRALTRRNTRAEGCFEANRGTRLSHFFTSLKQSDVCFDFSSILEIYSRFPFINSRYVLYLECQYHTRGPGTSTYNHDIMHMYSDIERIVSQVFNWTFSVFVTLSC